MSRSRRRLIPYVRALVTAIPDSSSCCRLCLLLCVHARRARVCVRRCSCVIRGCVWNYRIYTNTMSGSGIAFHSRSAQSFSETTSSQTQSETKSSGSNCPTKTSDDNCREDNNACYWPLFIFIILFIIVVIVCFCSGWGSCGTGSGAGWGGFGTAGAVGFALLFFIIWIIILWFFCRSGQMVGAWFFLLLIFALVFIWWIASVLANLGCC